MTTASVAADRCGFPCTEDFDDGVFDHASLSGLWHVSGACTPPAITNSSNVLAFNSDATCDYTSWQVGDPIEARLRVDLSDATSAYLRFDEIHDIEEAEAWDLLSVVAGTGTRETLLMGPKYFRPHEWRTVGLDLASVAGEPEAWIAWRLDPVDGGLNDTLGWLIDNVRIDAAPLCSGNDTRAAACNVSTLPYGNHQWTGGFTAEQDEFPACRVGTSTAWYRYEHKGAARSVEIYTRGSTYWLNVAVFLGSALVACEVVDFREPRADLSFVAIPGATYDIRISGPPQQPGYLLVEIR